MNNKRLARIVPLKTPKWGGVGWVGGGGEQKPIRTPAGKVMFPKNTGGRDAPWAKIWFCFDKDGSDSSTTFVGRRPCVVRNLLPIKSTCNHKVNGTAAVGVFIVFPSRRTPLWNLSSFFSCDCEYPPTLAQSAVLRVRGERKAVS